METSFGAYSFAFSYYKGYRDYFSTLLGCCNSSIINIYHLFKYGKYSINFMTVKKNSFNAALGYPGDTPKEKRKLNIFSSNARLLLQKKFQIFELGISRTISQCYWHYN